MEGMIFPTLQQNFDGHLTFLVLFASHQEIKHPFCLLNLQLAMSTVSASNVAFRASGRASSQPVVRMELWIDGKKKFQTTDDRLMKTMSVSMGTHTATVVEVDTANKVVKSSHTFTAK